MNMKLTKIVVVGVTAAAVLLPLLAFAALPVPTPGVAGTPVSLSEIEARIQQVAQFLIVVSVIIAVIMIVFGGIRWMLARGGDAADAKKTVLNGIIGAAIVLAVGLILQTLASVITRSFFN